MRAVITLSPDDFSRLCRDLSQRVKDAGLYPDAIVGIRHGGAYVAARMSPSFPGVPTYDVTLQRPSTRWKHRLAWLIGALPRRMADMLRRREASARMAFTLRGGHEAPVRLPEVPIPQALVASAPALVLVVDDSIDTGRTVAAVVSAIHEAMPGTRVAVAAIVLTESPTPVPPPAPARAPIAIYDDGTLIRFPWSLDSPWRRKFSCSSPLTPSPSSTLTTHGEVSQ